MYNKAKACIGQRVRRMDYRIGIRESRYLLLEYLAHLNMNGAMWVRGFAVGKAVRAARNHGRRHFNMNAGDYSRTQLVSTAAHLRLH